MPLSQGQLFSSESEEWYTPRKVVTAVNLFYNGWIDLDPCSNAHVWDGIPIVPAVTHYDFVDDGLRKAWFGKVYVNPPYGRKIKPWIPKAYSAYCKRELDECILLVPARTETAWFQPLWRAVLCFVVGRLVFGGPGDVGNSAPFPSVIAYYGKRQLDFAEHFQSLGQIVSARNLEDYGNG